jgi:hypothetical protein
MFFFRIHLTAEKSNSAMTGSKERHNSNLSTDKSSADNSFADNLPYTNLSANNLSADSSPPG